MSTVMGKFQKGLDVFARSLAEMAWIQIGGARGVVRAITAFHIFHLTWQASCIHEEPSCPNLLRGYVPNTMDLLVLLTPVCYKCSAASTTFTPTKYLYVYV